MTKPKRLSDQVRFKDALVLSAQWSNMAGTGDTELAMTGYPGPVKLWQWIDDVGPAERIDDGRLATWRDAVNFVADNESAALDWETLGISGAEPTYVGRLLALAWSDSEDGKVVARILSRFCDDSLALIESAGEGVFAEDVSQAIADAYDRMQAEGVEIDDLPCGLVVRNPGVQGLEDALVRAVEAVLAAREEQEAGEVARQNALKHWMPVIAQIKKRWTERYPLRRGGGMTLPVGWVQLVRYLEAYLGNEGELPRGAHRITGVPNPMAGVLDELVVDFDTLCASLEPHLIRNGHASRNQ